MRPHMSAADSTDPSDAFKSLRIAFAGKLGGMTKREAQNLVRDHGGTPVDPLSADVDLVVIGADELPLDEVSLLDESIRQQAAEGQLEVISETQFWQRLGMFDDESNVRLYTPAMLAELLKVPVSIIRRWHRRKLIVPVREVRRLPYFDFQEVATARQLAALLAAGASPGAIERKLAELSRYVPDVERPLAQLSVIVQGKQLLLRQGEGLIEPGGQLRFDFDALDQSALDQGALDQGALDQGALDQSAMDQGALDQRGNVPDEPAPVQATVRLPSDNVLSSSPAEMLELAATIEDEGQLEQAAELYRAVLAATGPTPEVCFQLAELLYRLGDVPAARERYYMAIELDEDYVEARANLGCVLAETGQLELAVAAFQGALVYHSEYPDAHYHLARTLDELGRRDTAEQHWREFLALASCSPWSDEARQRLGWGQPESGG
jgi:tetratricopeptide (TPR) repeat protein